MLEIVFFTITLTVIIILFKENSDLKKKNIHMQEQHAKLLKKHELLEHTQHNLIKVNAENHEKLKAINVLVSENRRLKYLLDKNNIDKNSMGQ